MISTPIYGAFNARWLSFEDVARTFVPVPQFLQLGHEGHSVLLGPRGCGKTTLLKMLTRRALDGWDASGRAERFQTSFSRPRYEAIYISSDVRWSYELTSLPETASLSPQLSLQAQRIMVSANALFSLLETIQGIVDSKRETEVIIAESLIKQWRLSNTLKSIADVKATLGRIVGEIRGYLNLGNREKLERVFDGIPATFYGHTLDAPIDAISLISDRLPKEICLPKWALCYDELEIAPAWLRTELLEALRSAQQNVYLKLTWSPLLPSGLRTSPEPAADFKAIRLWHSHVVDPRDFCEELARDFLRERFPGLHVTPDAFFSRSVLAAEGDEEPPNSYERGSTEYEVFKELASWDQSFRRLMNARNIDPSDPVPKSLLEKDQFFRKVKPVALLRLEFKSEKGARSRKRPAIYAGKEAVYAMSEGNPRWLRGLLNDFADLGGRAISKSSGTLSVRYKDQAKLLNTASQRFLALIRASPFKPPIGEEGSAGDRNVTLLGFVNAVGVFFHSQIYSHDFPLDPIGSFLVPTHSDDTTLSIIEQLLELGGLVYIGASPQDVPAAIRGSRFRLSFILAPIHRLALRTYREASLNDVLKGDENHQQGYLPL
jgi:hypothetical protein